MALLTTPLLALHLLAMNVAAAGPVIAVWLARRGRHSGVAGELGYRLLRRSLEGLVVGMATGGLLLLSPPEGMFDALARFPANAYWFAATELAFSALCLGMLLRTLGDGQPAGVLAWLLASATATNLLYHFPPLMAVLGELAANPHWTTVETIDRGALLELWKRPEILALWAHFVAGSFAVAALAAVWTPRAPAVERDDARAAQRARCAGRAGLVALGATLLQLPIGVALLAAENPPAREAMLGQDLWASAAFAGGLLAVFALVQSLGSIVWGDGPRAVPRAGWLMIAVVVLMAATLRLSREATTRDGALGSPPRVADDFKSK